MRFITRYDIIRESGDKIAELIRMGLIKEDEIVKILVDEKETIKLEVVLGLLHPLQVPETGEEVL